MKAQPFVVPRPPRQERAVLVGHAGGQRPKRSRGSRAGSAPGSRPGSGPGPLAGSVPRALDHAAVSTSAKDREHLDRSMDELALLADTAGATVASVLVQRRGTLHPATFLGKGKVAELKELAEMRDAELVIFDDDLSPAQVKNLEKALNRKVIDRSELILDIFARRARTRESRLQVELAQLEYTLPRLTGMWKHLERQAGGIGTRGPGETQLETDRRLVRERIARLKKELQAVERERETQRRRRRREFRAAIVGYTNAGKSTLFNALTRSHVLVEDRLFATLDATTRQLVSPTRQVALLTDTVGFIRKLPHHLVASFHSTLVEAIEADLLLHVVDAADPHFRRQIAAVEEVLEEILETPRPTTLVFNKVDLIDDPDVIAGLRVEFPDSFAVSAAKGEGLDELREFLWAQAAERAARAAS
jgi:GTP-binding protein HflX